MPDSREYKRGNGRGVAAKPKRKVRIYFIDNDLYVNVRDLIIVAYRDGDITAHQLDQLLGTADQPPVERK